MVDHDRIRHQFEEFVAARRSALLRTAFLLTGDHDDAEDLVQTALIRAIPHWSKIAHSPEPYVRTVLARESVTRWRRRRWREIASADPAGHLGQDTEAARDEDLDQRYRLRQELLQLSPRQRAVVVLRYLDDLTETQTAETLGISVGTVKSHTKDALTRLRARFIHLDDLGAGIPR